MKKESQASCFPSASGASPRPPSRRRLGGLAVALLFSPLASSPLEACSGSHLSGLLSREAVLVRTRVPIALEAGVGSLRFPVRTDSETARAFFDQGLAFLYSYSWWDAARSFRRALEEDPGLSIGHWGLSAAYLSLNAPDLAGEELQKALAGVPDRRLSQLERRWIELAAQRLEISRSAKEERHLSQRRYREAIDRWIAEEEDNPYLWLLRGLAEESDVLGRGQEGGEASIPFYLEAIRRDGGFFPAHHFLAHSYENVGDFALAERHGRRYRELAPAVPHAHHMHAHLLPPLGRWSEARDAFREADRLHLETAARRGSSPLETWHFAHNRRFLALAELHLGRSTEAEKLARSIFKLLPEDRRGAIYCTPLIEILLLGQRFDEATRAAQRCARQGGLGGEAIGAALAAEAALRSDRIGEAQRLLERSELSLRELWSEMAAARLADGHGSVVGYLARHLIRFVEAQLALRREPTRANRERVSRFARLWTSDPRFDGWGQAVLLRLKRLEAFAAELGHPPLAAELRELYQSKVSGRA